MFDKPISIRHSLVRSLVLLIALTAAALIATTLVVGFRAVDQLSQERIENRTTQTEEELDRFFGIVRDQVLIGRGWAEAGILDATDHRAMNRLFVPLLERTPYLSSLMVADANGAEYLLLRDPIEPHVWTNRVVQADAWGSRVLNRRWNTETGQVEEGFSELDYDPRRRIWYQGALTTGADKEVNWTQPVIFFITKDPGITAGTQYTPAKGAGPQQVVAFDLLLMDISRFTMKLDVSPNGKAFVLVEDPETKALRVVGLPRDARFADDTAVRDALVFLPPEEAVADSAAQLPPADTFDVTPIATLVAAWNEHGRSEEPLEIEADGETWWAGLRAYDLDENRFWIGVAVPEGDFLGDVAAQSLRISLVALVALLVAVFMAFRMARSYGRPLEKLARASDRIRQLDLESSETPDSNFLEIGQLADAQKQMVSALRSFARYVPADVVRELVRRGEVAQVGGRAVELSVLFTDIAGFTKVAEGMAPLDLTEHMAEYFEAMIGTLQAHGATVDKLVGDAIVAFWGAPKVQTDHAERAVRGTLACQSRLSELNRRWRRAGLPELPTRFAIATGPVVVGNIGARSRLAYTVLGDTVNLASRLEALNKVYGTYLLADASVHAACGDAFAWRRLDRIIARGRTTPTYVYEILGTVGETPIELQQAARRYEQAWDAYAGRRFEQAIDLLETLEPDGHGSHPVERLLDICRRFRAAPPATDWEAVTRMTNE